MYKNTLAILFTEKPHQYGLRGDKYFWEHLESYFSKIEFPYSETELMDDIYNQFRIITETDLTETVTPFVSQFATGGMSSGKLSGNFWINKAIPMILDRYKTQIKQ